MKLLRRIILILAAVLLLPLPARAAEGTVTVQYRREETPLAGVQFDLYRVEAPCADAQAAYAAVIQSGQADTASGRTDAAGILVFSGLADGTYLLVGQSHRVEDQVFEIEMSLLTLPGTDGSGHITLQPKFTVHDGTAPIEYRVIKLWEGGEGHPASVQVQCYRNGEPAEAVTLDTSNNWQYAWTESDPTAQWAVAEQVPGGYTAAYSRDGNDFVIQNTPASSDPTEPPESEPGASEPSDTTPTLPQTGQLWWPVPLLAIAGVILVLLGWLRRKEQIYEA